MASVREIQTARDKLLHAREELQELRGRIAQVRETVGDTPLSGLKKKLNVLITKRDKVDKELHEKCKEFLNESGLGSDEDEG